MIPRGGRTGSATWCRFLVGHTIEVVTKSVVVDTRRVPEQSDCRVGSHESMSPEGGKFADWHPVSRHDETLALVETAHDLSTLVAKLSLGDFSGHDDTV